MTRSVRLIERAEGPLGAMVEEVRNEEEVGSRLTRHSLLAKNQGGGKMSATIVHRSFRNARR